MYAKPKIVSLILVDGRTDWSSMEGPMQGENPWILFLHCISHIGLLAMQDIGEIPQVVKIMIVLDIQNWFHNNQMVATIINKMCLKVYGQTREFLWVPGTCFVMIIILLK